MFHARRSWVLWQRRQEEEGQTCSASANFPTLAKPMTAIWCDVRESGLVIGRTRTSSAILTHLHAHFGALYQDFPPITSPSWWNFFETVRQIFSGVSLSVTYCSQGATSTSLWPVLLTLYPSYLIRITLAADETTDGNPV
ncbi:hypothetical protein Pmani_021518 [Petrolisthes manimaculis]|uniref:Uncharacterized protein n=1 Tax=Petrolisthes manimaculis TaxID=1843537 RepID=A0AAE1PE05_9EUCA|nr:hypothetical protein Pmani_021518 [Petrolisthes manimaculis]